MRVLHGDDYYFDTPEHGVWMRDEAGIPRLDVGDPRSVEFGHLNRDTDTALATASVVIVDGLFARRVTPQISCERFDVFVGLPPTSGWPGRFSASACETASPSMSSYVTTCNTGAPPTRNTSNPKGMHATWWSMEAPPPRHWPADLVGRR
ncbi:hypothetical protein ACFCY8_32385 [Streptomyces noursei]|uniref:hypothetical protein n=1 Tax=Streptomyces noursei TaxID=1971 RepID=UPI0035D6C833